MAQGSGSGTVKGKKYFTCGDDRGCFVSRVTPLAASLQKGKAFRFIFERHARCFGGESLPQNSGRGLAAGLNCLTRMACMFRELNLAENRTGWNTTFRNPFASKLNPGRPILKRIKKR